MKKDIALTQEMPPESIARMDSHQRRALRREMQRTGLNIQKEPAPEPNPIEKIPFYETAIFAIAFAILSIAIGCLLAVLGVRMKNLSWLFIPAWCFASIGCGLLCHWIVQRKLRFLVRWVILPVCLALILFKIDRAFPGTEAKEVTIKWDNPSPISAGTHLSGEQLNAIAVSDDRTVEGEFVYDPTFGDQLTPGSTHTLHTKFMPKDASAYRESEKTVLLVVNPPAAQPTQAPKPARDRLGQRTLEDWQIERLRTVLSQFPEQKIVIFATPGEETVQYAKQFKEIFKRSHWIVAGPLNAPSKETFADVSMSANDTYFAKAGEIPNSFRALRETITFLNLKSRSGFTFDPKVERGIIAFVVGPKSPDGVNLNDTYMPGAMDIFVNDKLFNH